MQHLWSKTRYMPGGTRYSSSVSSPFPYLLYFLSILMALHKEYVFQTNLGLHVLSAWFYLPYSNSTLISFPFCLHFKGSIPNCLLGIYKYMDICMDIYTLHIYVYTHTQTHIYLNMAPKPNVGQIDIFFFKNAGFCFVLFSFWVSLEVLK